MLQYGDTVGPGEVNVWSDPVLEFGAYRAAGRPQERSPMAANLELLLRARALAEPRAPAGFVLEDETARRAHALAREAYVTLLDGDRPGAIELASRALALAPGDARLVRVRRRIEGASSSVR